MEWADKILDMLARKVSYVPPAKDAVLEATIKELRRVGSELQQTEELFREHVERLKESE